MTSGTLAAPAETLSALRTAHGLSREELAALAGISARTLYDLEHGLTRPLRSTATVLAAVLGCSADELRGMGAGD
jgi:transcriptional regulator with XRE-family HTH domain